MTTTLTKGPFKADHVGSFLRPERIKQARLQVENGEMTNKQLRAIEDEEIQKLVEKQKQIGLKAVTDGEFRRAWWHFDFLSELVGVELYEAESGIQFHGVQTKAHGIKVTGKLDFNHHPMIEDYKFLHQAAGKEYVAKFTIPSPNMLFFRGHIEESAYSDTDVFFADLVKTYQKAIQAFYDAGCRYLQLDDTAWAVFFSEKGQEQIASKGFTPQELLKRFTDAINESIAHKPDDMVITMHICRGNFQSTYTASGGYENASKAIFSQLNVDGLFLEFDDERSGGFEPLRHVKRDDLQIVLGLITSKFGDLEDPEAVKKRIAKAAEFVSLDQICLSPQCGFASTEEGNLLTEEQQWDKVKHVISIAEDVWK
ncbi:5-methyltetrahydropteroyltriglutamate--homocysteine S-methyltransferase [Bacillus megaterium]|uniref:5-methyltetrahydropteroyltriglutamate-- homocysteine S-methyltransferase n=1 Tax=Priestia megaterium TaxID=1404 RepID=UPI001293CE28|nr:5-methyltetrahydropteroyltriglutamate--homocysteine S-methyltransferase [Priestia megaterium]MQR87241.1 5-methyltetrahydropteroyltriglutamate--homocysteine S-methyltransferase [Priestia megaterium]